MYRGLGWREEESTQPGQGSEMASGLPRSTSCTAGLGFPQEKLLDFQDDGPFLPLPPKFPQSSEHRF